MDDYCTHCPDGECLRSLRAYMQAEEVKTEEEIIKGIEAYRNSIVHIESKCWDGKEKVYRAGHFRDL